MTSDGSATIAAPPSATTRPVLGFLLAALTVRAVGLTLHYFGTDPGGRPIAASPLNTLAIALVYHAAVLTALGTVLSLAQRLANRTWTVRAAALLFGASMLAGQIDLGLLRYIGQNFTPSIAGTYIGRGMMTTALWQPLAFDWPYVVRSLALVAAGWAWILAVARRAGAPPAAPPASWRLIATMGMASLCAAPVLSAVGGQRQFVVPPEVGLLPLVTGESTAPPQDEAGARADLQRMLDPAGTAVWLDPRYPLVHRPSPGSAAPAPAELPDIIVLMVESLRGRDVGYLRPPGSPSLTPNLDRLASRAVVFPRLIANGFPTAPGFFTLNTALWSHRRRIMTSHFAGTAVDALPQRLRARGYHTVWVHGANPSFDNQLQWANRWYDDTVYDLPENRWLYVRRMNDLVFMRRAINVLNTHDGRGGGRPLFLFLSTAGMHPPFTLKDSLFEPFTTMGDASRMDTMGIDSPQQRYDLVLSAFDYAFGELLAALDRRARRHDTVLIVTGDHSSATNDPADPDLRGMPTDETVWTTALIAGPPGLTGPVPRQAAFPASHADVMPTVLAMVGDNGPTAAMGRNLLDERLNDRIAVAIRPGGYRLDRGGESLLMSADVPGRSVVFTPFQANASIRKGLAGSSFSQEDERQLRSAVDFVSFLIEQNRVWPGPAAGIRPGSRPQ